MSRTRTNVLSMPRAERAYGPYRLAMNPDVMALLLAKARRERAHVIAGLITGLLARSVTALGRLVKGGGLHRRPHPNPLRPRSAD